MKIGMLSQWFDPETGPAALPGIFAREFVRQGHNVSVLTGFPNYPDGRVYPGYAMRPVGREGVPPLRVTRVPLYPSHSQSALGRVANYGSFSASATLLGGKALRGADAIWVYNSPITVALPLLVHSSLGKTPIFFHVQDVWPDSLVESGMFPNGGLGKIATDAISSLVRFIERRAAVIGVISPSVKELIVQRHPGIDPEKIVYAPNPTNEHLFRPSSAIRRELGVDRDADAFNIMYAGAIGEVQGLDAVLDAMELLSDRPDIHLTMVGDGISRARLEADANMRRLINVTFVGRVPQTDVPRLIAQTDAQLVSLADSPFLAYTTPSKIPSLLASEVPVVAQISGDGARLLEQSGAALVVEPGDTERLAQAIRRMADMAQEGRQEMATRGRLFYESNFSAAYAARTITAALEEYISVEGI